jgi:hypothetical protein
VVIGSEREDGPQFAAEMTGQLRAGWDEDVAQSNGVGDVAVFGFVEYEHASVALDREYFRSAYTVDEDFLG